MDLLDDEVFAVLTAVVIVASVFTAATILRPENPEPFTGIGLLNQHCKIGEYPSKVYLGENLTLCLYLDNHQPHPTLFQVQYKIATNPSQLPTNTTPSPAQQVASYQYYLPTLSNHTTHIKLPIPHNPSLNQKNITLILELWQYNPDQDSWEYTGRWVHLHVKAEEVLPP